MKINKKYSKSLKILLIAFLVLFTCLSVFYYRWNSVSPSKSCASCHEIECSVSSFSKSSHREIHCKECHGTALSNGIHSLKEKGNMLINHFSDKDLEKIKINEEELLNMIENCKRCHSSEFASWKSGGHSATYSDLFLDTTHNNTEQLNSDCLRCHGMFFNGSTDELVKPLNTKGPWILLKPEKASQPAIPCMACHQIHSEGDTATIPDYANPALIFYTIKNSYPIISFYDRHEKVNIPTTMLPKLKLIKEDKPVNVSDEPIMRNCIQCHAPNGFHEAGSSDDRTPRGVHEGLSCISCHEPHSNNAKNSCIACHPAISNCKIDVCIMNTSYADKNSPNNIHWVSCKDCHKNDKKIQEK